MKSTMSLFLVSIFSLASGINNAEDCKPAIPLKDNTPFPAIFAVFVSDTLPDVPKSLSALRVEDEVRLAEEIVAVEACDDMVADADMVEDTLFFKDPFTVTEPEHVIPTAPLNSTEPFCDVVAEELIAADDLASSLASLPTVAEADRLIGLVLSPAETTEPEVVMSAAPNIIMLPVEDTDAVDVTEAEACCVALCPVTATVDEDDIETEFPAPPPSVTEPLAFIVASLAEPARASWNATIELWNE